MIKYHKDWGWFFWQIPDKVFLELAQELVFICKKQIFPS
jgi:hypothetical protein